MAGTDHRQKKDLGPSPSVVLVNPQLGENIGMAARAMANFGLADLLLVGPRTDWDKEKALATASGAAETVANARVEPVLAVALKSYHYVYATTARPRGMTKEVMTPEQASADMHRRIGEGQKIAILFGRERYGLTNDEVSLADMIITAPVNPAYASLNIAQAVLLVGYEWYKPMASTLGMETQELPALEGPGLQMPGTQPATKEELYGFLDHLEGELAAAGFFKTDDKRPGMVRNMRNLFARAQPSEQEVRSLRGIVSSLTRVHELRKEKLEKEKQGK